MMPRMDGFQLLERVRENPAWVFIPFIFLSARTQTADIHMGKRMGADDYLVKPYDRENLLATVDARLARAQSVASAAAAEISELKLNITRTLGHELRTPLTWIQGYAELLLGNVDSLTPDELHLALHSIKCGSDRLAHLVEDAVLVTQLESGQAREEYMLTARVESDLAIHIEPVLLRLEPEAARKNVRIEHCLPEGLAPVRMAPRFFAETMYRIVGNGIKFARPDTDSYVRVEVQDAGGEVRISVADNGVGIPAEQLGEIFDPLVQVNRGLQEQQGTGLGLAVARGLVELHDGRIWAESEPGAGTTVYIALPCADA